MVLIEKGIPLKPRQRGSWQPIFQSMEIGDSFKFEGKPGPMRNQAHAWGRSLNRKFTIRKQDDGSYRCWRIK